MQKSKQRLRGPGAGANQKTLMTDAQVLECRRRYEFEGWTIPRLCKEYGMTDGYMRALLSYKTRSKLFPERKNINVSKAS